MWKKNEWIYGVYLYNKTLYNEQRKIYILRDIKIFVKMPFSVCVCVCVTIEHCSKTIEGIKTKFYIEIKTDQF